MTQKMRNYLILVGIFGGLFLLLAVVKAVEPKDMRTPAEKYYEREIALARTPEIKQIYQQMLDEYHAMDLDQQYRQDEILGKLGDGRSNSELRRRAYQQEQDFCELNPHLC